MANNLDKILTRLGYLYLVLPYFLFVCTWLSLPYALIFGLITLFCFLFCLKNTQNSIYFSQLLINHKKQVISGVLLTILIMYFSGIGSFTFQNQDFLYRNAIFRDLVKFQWPVMYHVKGFGHHILEGKTTVMTYYLGFFLVPAYLGKIFGFQFGQFALLAWAFFGLLLTIYQVGKYLNRFNLKLFLLFFSWGTLFFIGEIYKYSLIDIFQEKQALWAGMILYADSNLSLIYWTFNQSLTAWLIIILIMNNESKRNVVFLYSLCFFLSPFACVGLLPFMFYYFYKNFEGVFNSFENWLENIKDYFSFQNIVGCAAVIGLNYFYLSSNQASSFIQTLSHKPLLLFVFLLLSWGVIVLLIYNKYKKDPLYWIIIAVLLPLPFFQLGYGIDFPGRISIPALFILMLLVGKYMIEEKKGILKSGVLLYLLLTGIWHLFFETGRSIYYTTKQTLSQQTELGNRWSKSKNKQLANFGNELVELRKQNILIKDLGTLTNPKNEVIWNYMANIENNRFYKYLARKNSPK